MQRTLEGFVEPLMTQDDTELYCAIIEEHVRDGARHDWEPFWRGTPREDRDEAEIELLEECCRQQMQQNTYGEWWREV